MCEHIFSYCSFHETLTGRKCFYLLCSDSFTVSLPSTVALRAHIETEMFYE